MISSVPPVQYGQRFTRFMFSVIRGGDKSQRPKVRLQTMGRSADSPQME